MDYEDKYKNALERAKIIYTDKYKPEVAAFCKQTLESIFPELAESEDGKIRKEIISALKWANDEGTYDKHIAWLEKLEDCEHIKKDWLEHIKQSWYKEGFIDGKYNGGTSKEWTINDDTTLNELIDFLENGTSKLQHDLTKYANWLKIKFTPIEKQAEQVKCPQDLQIPNGGIVLEDFNGGEGHYKVNLDFLNKKQVEEIEKIVNDWNKDTENVKNCIGMILTDASEQRFKDYGLSLKECLDWLEKQGESNRPLYIRFGDIPSDEKSKIYCNEDEIGIEEGVSVYPAFETNGDIVIGLSLPITQTTLHTQQHLLEYESKPCYLVTGDYVGKGSDGEPLIKNVRIIKEIKYRIRRNNI